MPSVLLFLPEGFEETEALTTADILRRASVLVTTVSLTDNWSVTGSHQISVTADSRISDLPDPMAHDMLILPGGPGTFHYNDCELLMELIKAYDRAGKQLAAICAAPTILCSAGLLQGKRAVCFPGKREQMEGAVLTQNEVETDGCITTSRAAGTTVAFARRLVEILQGKETAENVYMSFMGLA